MMYTKTGLSSSFSSLLLSSLELSDTKVYEPQIRARLRTAAHFCEVVVSQHKTRRSGAARVHVEGVDRPGEVPRGEKTLYAGTDPESYITEYTIVYDDEMFSPELEARFWPWTFEMSRADSRADLP